MKTVRLEDQQYHARLMLACFKLSPEDEARCRNLLAERPIRFMPWPEARVVEPHDPEEWARLSWERLLARWERQGKARVV